MRRHRPRTIQSNVFHQLRTVEPRLALAVESARDMSSNQDEPRSAIEMEIRRGRTTHAMPDASVEESENRLLTRSVGVPRLFLFDEVHEAIVVSQSLERGEIDIRHGQVERSFPSDDLPESRRTLVRFSVITMDEFLAASRAPLTTTPSHHASTMESPPRTMSAPIHARPMRTAISPHRAVPANGSAMISSGAVSCWMRSSTPPSPWPQS